jgi:hypothetical protein
MKFPQEKHTYKMVDGEKEKLLELLGSEEKPEKE